MNLPLLTLYVSLSGLIMFFTLHKLLQTNRRSRICGAVCFLLMLGSYFITVYTAKIPRLQSYTPLLSIVRTVFGMLLILIFVLSTDSPLKEKLQAYFTVYISTFLAEVVMTALYSYVFGLSQMEAISGTTREQVFRYAQNLLLYLTAALLSYVYCKRKRLKQSERITAAFGVLFFMFCFLASLVTAVTYNINSAYTKFMFALVIALTCAALIPLYIIFMYIGKQEKQREQLIWLQKMQTAEAEYYKAMQEKHEELCCLRHDIKDQLLSVRTLLQTGDAAGVSTAEKMLDTLQDSLQSAQLPIYSRNILVNTVLTAKAQVAEAHGIETDFSVQLPASLSWLDPVDLNSVFFNLLNNAIEACCKLPEGQRKYIVCCAAVRGDMLVIKSTNPYTEIRRDKRGRLRTTKADAHNHGLGLLMLQNIAKKYDGCLQTDAADGVFTALISLHFPKNSGASKTSETA